MSGIHAGIDDGDDLTGAVEALCPGLVGADDIDAVHQDRSVDPVFRHPLHR